MQLYYSTNVPVRSFFVFHAEDGIRYSSVTGVQTCALPISAGMHDAASSNTVRRSVLAVGGSYGSLPQVVGLSPDWVHEERHVGHFCNFGSSHAGGAREIGRASCRERVGSVEGGGRVRITEG